MGKASRKKKNVRPESGSAAEVVDRAVPAGSRAPATATPPVVRSRPALAICLALVVANLLIYAPVRHFAFTNTDDPNYVTDNVKVLAGLSWTNVEYAFTEAKVPYWHPLTFLSHMLDVELYGTNAAGHHLTSVVLHIACSVMLFALL